MNKPAVDSAPRMLGSLISLTNVKVGDSFSPIQNPITANPVQINGNDCENPRRIQASVNGTVETKIILRRPNLSQMGPLITAPIGWVMYAHVAEMSSKCFSRSLEMFSLKISLKTHPTMMFERL